MHARTNGFYIIIGIIFSEKTLYNLRKTMLSFTVVDLLLPFKVTQNLHLDSKCEIGPH